MPVAGSTLRAATPTLMVVQAPLGLSPPENFLELVIASTSGFPVVLTHITIQHVRGVCKSKTSYFRVGFVTPVLLGDVCFDSTVATVDNVGVLSLDSSGSGVGVHVGGFCEGVSEPVVGVSAVFHLADCGC